MIQASNHKLDNLNDKYYKFKSNRLQRCPVRFLRYQKKRKKMSFRRGTRRNLNTKTARFLPSVEMTTLPQKPNRTLLNRIKTISTKMVKLRSLL